jgi:hypothetical protein
MRARQLIRDEKNKQATGRLQTRRNLRRARRIKKVSVLFIGQTFLASTELYSFSIP